LALEQPPFWLFSVVVREGEGHFPLSPKDPKSVVDFITISSH
jgi:hypothetical protein